MARKGKLLTALDAHRGRDIEAEKQKKQIRAAGKRKRDRAQNTSDDFAAFSEDEGSENLGQDESLAKTNSEEIAMNGQGVEESESESDSNQDEDEDSDVPISDLEDEDMEDAIPHQRLTINNGPALISSSNSISLIKNHKTPFHYHNSLVSKLAPATETIPDPNDDLTRELEFYRIARDGAVEARGLLKKEKIPFTRPNDYFAEMVKSDEHMGKVKQKLYSDAAGKKAAMEARKLRDAKKFGKAVQVAKEQQRSKEKRDTLDKIKELKRKRKGNDTGRVNEGDGGVDDDLFEKVDVENSSSTRDRNQRGENNRRSNFKRQKRDSKYGYGGKKRFSKSGDAISTADVSGFSARGMKDRGGGSGGGGRGRPSAKRLGKSRRAAASR